MRRSLKRHGARHDSRYKVLAIRRDSPWSLLLFPGDLSSTLSLMMLFRHPFRQRTLLSFSLPALFSTMASSPPPGGPAGGPPGGPPSKAYPSYRYQPRTQSFPYTAKDFSRADEADDTDFYATPRLVYHIDDNAVSLLSEYYAQVLPQGGRILDFCSSWVIPNAPL